jgi:ferric-dicitrate binding protein FerR (iron transport regulator)
LTTDRLTYLVQSARAKQITPDELDELMLLIRTDSTGEIYEQLNELHQDVLSAGSLQAYDPVYWQQAFHEITGQTKPVARVYVLRKWWWAAASIVVMLAVGTYFLTANKKTGHSTTKTQKQADVPPGGQKAVLTLADGKTIVLDNAANGNLAQQGNAEVVKLADGQITYNVKDLAAKDVMWNTMSTPTGGTYQVTLPDGTKVWLNAASAITYPTAFAGNKREVTIKGEAYFEVTKNKQKPFIVDIDGKSRVEVLGTIFNINSYDNEPGIHTTLVEGSVKITKATQSAILKPGQQAIVASGITVKSNANIDQVLAWKNGLFEFEGLDLPAVLRQLERWYDIKVQYRRAVDNGQYGGRLLRSVNLSEILAILEQVSDVKFKLEGKTLMVL